MAIALINLLKIHYNVDVVIKTLDNTFINQDTENLFNTIFKTTSNKHLELLQIEYGYMNETLSDELTDFEIQENEFDRADFLDFK